jgi:hypothetical protein
MFPWFRVSADSSYHPERSSHDKTLYISYSMLSCNQKHMFFSLRSTTNLDIKYPFSPEEKYRSQHNHRTTHINVAIITKTMARCKTNCHPRMLEGKGRVSLSLFRRSWNQVLFPRPLHGLVGFLTVSFFPFLHSATFDRLEQKTLGSSREHCTREQNRDVR